jgi:hypothetical protein
MRNRIACENGWGGPLVKMQVAVAGEDDCISYYDFETPEECST